MCEPPLYLLVLRSLGCEMADLAVELLDQQEEDQVTQDLDLIELYENETALWAVTSKNMQTKIKEGKHLKNRCSVENSR